ncbi:hypothetical protein [Nonomuraea sp. NPDC049504]|uniref:hypothetical protein n=1 Tax=Nonomuraea sp. NPDC049504 TaxID=3154729 RepID=UPI00344579E7
MEGEREIFEIDEQRVYSEQRRADTLATLRDIMGGPPPADMLDLADRREEEFAARRAAHAA